MLHALLNLRAEASVTVPVARAALVDSSAGVRASAALALGGLGRGPTPAIPELVTALGDADPNVVRNAIFAISSIGPSAQSALPGLR